MVTVCGLKKLVSQVRSQPSQSGENLRFNIRVGFGVSVDVGGFDGDGEGGCWMDGWRAKGKEDFVWVGAGLNE